MSDQTINGPSETTPVGDDEATRVERLQSSVQFPYTDLEAAISVANAIVGMGGAGGTPSQVAAAMGQEPTSGNFRQKVAAARMFGLVETGPKKISLTDLGYEITDPATERGARASSFLNVELYSKVFGEFDGKPLPPRPKAFERMLERHGVSPKQTDKARHAFDRSAQQAGFYEYGKEKLVMPAAVGGEQSARRERRDPPPPGGGGGDGGGRGGGGERTPPDVDPIIKGLFDRLPPSGQKWPKTKRKLWLQIIENSFDLVYEDDDDLVG